MTAACWHCGKPLGELPKPLSFRALCPHCDAYLHCCKNCIHYQPGSPNDCRVPGTEPVRDREASNFCEEFALLGKPPPPKVDPNDVIKRLFSD